MLGRSSKVLILGCGTIGQIKADLWLSLGADVYLHDTDPLQVDRLLVADKRLKRFSYRDTDNLTVDISTPNNQHASSLLWTFETIKNPETILIEKPICTNDSDKSLINRLLNAYRGIPMYVNESYFWSSALDWLLNQLIVNDEKIASIEINLSKNRLADTRAGRFFDRELESYSIEIPHTIAILQKFGVDIDELEVRTNTMYRSKKNSVNQGVCLTFSDASNRTIKIDSFLGDFMIRNGSTIQNSRARWLIVKTSKQNEYHVSFDPAPNEPRFKSVVMINGSEKVILNDDHLRRHLEQVQLSELDSTMKQYLSPTNSIAIYDFLKKLYDGRIENYVPEEVVKDSKVGERAGVV